MSTWGVSYRIPITLNISGCQQYNTRLPDWIAELSAISPRPRPDGERRPRALPLIFFVTWIFWRKKPCYMLDETWFETGNCWEDSCTAPFDSATSQHVLEWIFLSLPGVGRPQPEWRHQLQWRNGGRAEHLEDQRRRKGHEGCHLKLRLRQSGKTEQAQGGGETKEWEQQQQQRQLAALFR